MNKKKVCVIGAGLSGLSAGFLFSKNGYDVTIFEKEEIIGGRALSLDGNTLTKLNYIKILSSYNMAIAFSEPSLEEIFNKKMLQGYKLDLGFHSVEGGTMSDIGRITIQAESKIEMLGTKLGLINEKGYSFPLVTTKDKIYFLPQILRLVLSREGTMKHLDNVSIAETINKYGKGKMKLILELLPRVTTTVNDLRKISTGESFRASQSNLKRGSSPVGYPIGGLVSINKALSNAIKKNGGKIHLGKKVEKIIIKKEKATGIKIKNKQINFDIIIYSGLIQNLFNIADEKHFPKEYIGYINSLQGTGSLCAYYSFKNIKTDLIGKSFLFLERNIGVEGDDAVGMIEFVTANPVVNISPRSEFLVQSYIICTPKEAKSKKTLEKFKYILDKNLERLYPNYKKFLNWAIYPTVWHLDGVAKTIDNKKVNMKTSIENLFLIGDCTKAPGIGVNCAVKSANILYNSLKT
jgi:hypothetical protein